MNRLLRHRPSPAMVVASIALAVALGGTSYAAITLPKNSVGTKQLKKNAVKRSKIAAKAVNGSKVAADSLTGANILESSLSPVPSATKATNATHATSADSATNADHATTADSVPALSFTDLTLKNGWSTCSGGGVPGIAKSSEGVVHFRGFICRTSGSSNNPFAVPAGFVPSWTEVIPVSQDGLTTGQIWVRLDGDALVYGSNAASFTSLAGASYTLPY